MANRRPCPMPNCDQPSAGRGWCSEHYQLDPETRFWLRMAKTEGDCWEWTGSRSPKGYGFVQFAGKVRRTSRVAWTLIHGEIPDGMVICHRCDNPPCCRPDHLFLGTQAENQQDMVRKGRAAKAKLTPDEVREVRSLLAAGFGRREIAARTNANVQQVDHIRTGRSWAHLDAAG